MTDPNDRNQPEPSGSYWQPQQPLPAYAPPPVAPKKTHTTRNVVLICVGALVVLFVVARVFGSMSGSPSSQTKAKAAATTAPATSEAYTPPPATETDTSTEDSGDTGPTVARLGESVHLTWDDGEANVVVTKVREVNIAYESPEHARYVEAFVRYHVLKGSLDVSIFDWSSLARSHRTYDATITGADNELDSTTVRRGSFTDGWLVFDVGNSPIVQIQYAPNYGGDVVCYWQAHI
jgi:hypothetical protein